MSPYYDDGGTPAPDCGCRVANTTPWALQLCPRHSAEGKAE